MLAITMVFLSVLALLFCRAADISEGTDYTITVTHRESESVTPEAPAPLDINTASSEDLQTLPGIGPAIAQRIIAYRAEHGPFASVEDLLNVKGIGEASLNEFRDLVTVGTAPNETTEAEDHAE